MTLCTLRQDDGYTTLEAVVAAVLLSAVLLPLVAFGVYLSLDRTAARRSRALSEAEARLEAMIASPHAGEDSARAGGIVLRTRGWYEGALFVAEVEARGVRTPTGVLRLRSATLVRPSR